MVLPLIVQLCANDKKHIVCHENDEAEVSLAIQRFVWIAVDLENITN